MNWMTNKCKSVWRVEYCVLGVVNWASVHVVNTKCIHYSINCHCRMLEEFDREMDHTDSRMRSLTSRVNKAIKKTGSKCQIITILILVIVLIVVIAFFFIPF